jgi:hypothetical protein
MGACTMKRKLDAERTAVLLVVACWALAVVGVVLIAL